MDLLSDEEVTRFSYTSKKEMFEFMVKILNPVLAEIFASLSHHDEPNHVYYDDVIKSLPIYMGTMKGEGRIIREKTFFSILQELHPSTYTDKAVILLQKYVEYCLMNKIIKDNLVQMRIVGVDLRQHIYTLFTKIVKNKRIELELINQLNHFINVLLKIVVEKAGSNKTGYKDRLIESKDLVYAIKVILPNSNINNTLINTAFLDKYIKENSKFSLTDGSKTHLVSVFNHTFTLLFSNISSVKDVYFNDVLSSFSSHELKSIKDKINFVFLTYPEENGSTIFYDPNIVYLENENTYI
jgi:hypothetical protein